ncbi:unnamed protein product [Paramecium octaurelia]|uniref:Transmembrane protein n=1 Tax=Paramecium octaurelia TaxID=43137 RepID=A0A8S1W6R1_PAROT|nr:unnamed protein product [Paramecium octaurelia]
MSFVTKIKNQAQEKYNQIMKKKTEQYQEMNEENRGQENKQQENKMDNEKVIDEQPKNDDSAPNKPEEKPRQGTISYIKTNLTAAGDYLSNKVVEAQKTVTLQLQKVDTSVKQAILKQKQSFNKWIALKIDQRISRSLKQMETKISLSVQKAVPSSCCFDFVNDAVLSLWTDASNLIRFELRVSIDEPIITLSKRPDKNKWLKPWYRLRNWILYSLYPFDVEPGKQLRSPSFLFIKLLQVIPYYGIQVFTFLIIFLAIDKTEEYQVVNYILDYKNIQFFTAGVLNALIGFFSYFYCATLKPAHDFINEKDQGLKLNYCFSHGPGAESHLILSQISYFTQVILIWCAFAVLHKTKSRADFISNEIKRQESIKRGGRLTGFMIYDLICFVGTCSLTGYIYYNYYYKKDDTFYMLPYVGNLIYFSHLMYGFLSLPFVIFVVPFFVRMFTSAIPTAYDQYGNVVPCINQMKLNYEELPLEQQDEIDIEEALENQ